METCKDCKYWLERSTPSDGEGYCRRYPPFMIAEITSDTGYDSDRVQSVYSYGPNTYWPEVKELDWCGEFKARKEKKEK